MCFSVSPLTVYQINVHMCEESTDSYWEPEKRRLDIDMIQWRIDTILLIVLTYLITAFRKSKAASATSLCNCVLGIFLARATDV